MSNPAQSVRIGTMIQASSGQAAERIAEIADLGFESFEPFFWQTTNEQDLAELGKRCREAIGDRDITISTLGMFGNPLEDGELDRQTSRDGRIASTTRITSARPASPASRAGCAASHSRQPAALQASVVRARQARCRQRHQDRLRELRHGGQLANRRLEHRPQSRRLGADLQRDPRRPYRARMGTLPPARHLIDPLPQTANGRTNSSTCMARTRRSAGR